MARAGNILMEL